MNNNDNKCAWKKDCSPIFSKSLHPLSGMLSVVGLFAACIGLTGCVNTATLLAGGSSAITGSAGAAGTHEQSKQLVKCSRPIGYAVLVEPSTRYISIFSDLGLDSPVPLVKLIMTQSGCFKVVNRGAASEALERERALATRGQLQKGSNMGGGQMVAADYLITPTIVNKDSDAGGSMAGIGALLPSYLGVIAGAIKVQSLEAQTMLEVTNVRTGVQEAIATGSASKNNISFGALGAVGGVGGLGGGYDSTDIGKIVTAAFLDAHNNLVKQLDVSVVIANEDSAGYFTITTLDLRSGPSISTPALSTLPERSAVSLTGIKKDGWWQVEAGGYTGWVRSDYLSR